MQSHFNCAAACCFHAGAMMALTKTGTGRVDYKYLEPSHDKILLKSQVIREILCYLYLPVWKVVFISVLFLLVAVLIYT